MRKLVGISNRFLVAASCALLLINAAWSSSAVSSTGWKGDLIEFLGEMVDEMHFAIGAEGGQGLNLAAQAIAGFCVGVAQGAGKPAPDEAINMVTSVFERGMAGEFPTMRSIHMMTLSCVDFLADVLAAQGHTQEEIRLVIVPEFKRKFLAQYSHVLKKETPQ